MVKIGFRVKKYNFEKIPLKGKLIICSNHISYIDPVVIGSNIGRYVYFMAKRELFSNRVLASLVTFFNSFPVNRTSGDTSSIRTSLKILEDGQALGLFPEGTRSVDGQVKDGKRGVGMLAVMSDAPIIPVAITGANKIIQKPHKRLFFPQIKMIAGDLIDVKSIKQEYGRKQAILVIVDQVMDSIKKLLKEINED
ncbi:MAG: lysophospholipid acyltransferase family protein [Actinomycetota bacterium]|nr:lysophospholipid acyltransferase family protein [Actinomycetota bacterium]